MICEAISFSFDDPLGTDEVCYTVLGFTTCYYKMADTLVKSLIYLGGRYSRSLYWNLKSIVV